MALKHAVKNGISPLFFQGQKRRPIREGHLRVAFSFPIFSEALRAWAVIGQPGAPTARHLAARSHAVVGQQLRQALAGLQPP